jgi:hypothetical protein
VNLRYRIKIFNGHYKNNFEQDEFNKNEYYKVDQEMTNYVIIKGWMIPKDYLASEKEDHDNNFNEKMEDFLK